MLHGIMPPVLPTGFRKFGIIPFTRPERKFSKFPDSAMGWNWTIDMKKINTHKVNVKRCKMV